MLDYTNWYLVELERKLRGVHRSDDLITETKVHLEERTDELLSKGFDRTTASRMAIADFGDPAAIAWSARQRAFPSRKSAIGWSIVAGLLLVSWMPASFMQTFGIGRYEEAINYLLGPIIALVLTLFFVARYRVWFAVWALGVALCISLVASLFGAATGTPLNVPGSGQTTFVAYSAMPGQVRVREHWLEKSEPEIAKLTTLLADAKAGKSVAWDALLGSKGPYFSPVQYERYGYGAQILPSDHNERWQNIWIRLGPTTFGQWGLSFYYPRDAAVDAWKKSGDAYLSGIRAHQSEVKEEIALLANPPEVGFANRFTFVAMGMFSLTLMLGLPMLLLNTALIAISGLIRKTRVLVWRKTIA